MRKLELFLAASLVAAMVLVACSKTESDIITGATTEPNDALASDRTSSDTIEQNLIMDPNHLRDTVLAHFDKATKGYAQDSGAVQPTTSSSHTDYNFTTLREAFFEEQNCYVSIYEQEAGARVLFGTKEQKGSFVATSLYYQEDGVLLRFVNNAYWGGACEQDLAAFENECEMEQGLFNDYLNGTGCNFGKLQLACALLVGSDSVRTVLQSEAILYKQKCEINVIPEEKPCTVVCGINAGMETQCDTTCSE